MSLSLHALKLRIYNDFTTVDRSAVGLSTINVSAHRQVTIDVLERLWNFMNLVQIDQPFLLWGLIITVLTRWTSKCPGSRSSFFIALEFHLKHHPILEQLVLLQNRVNP